MKGISFILMMILGWVAADAARLSSEPDSIVSRSVIVRKDTVAVNDTIVRRRLVERRDTVRRTEVTLGEEIFLLSTGGDTIVNGLKIMKPKSDGVEQKGYCAVTAEPPVVTLPMATVDSLKTVAEFPARNGGEYLWVPDSLKGRVEALMEGKVAVAPEEQLETRALFRGDTVPMILRSRNFGRFDRGLFNHLFIPRGIWQFGATASYGEFNTKDLEVFDLLSDIDFSGHIFSVRPYVQYFIGNNMSVGMRLAYTSGKANIDSFKVDIDEDMNFNLHDIMYRSESYSAALLFNQYFGITPRGRFGIFNEVELAFSSGNSDFVRPYNGEPKHTHSTSMGVGLNFSPGLSIFMMEPVSFNVSFGVFGFSLRSEKQMVDGVDMGRRLTSGANFRFNIFNINFGIAVNL